MSAVDQALASAQLPVLKWGNLGDVAPVLKPIYADEPDRLLWFDGATPDRQRRGGDCRDRRRRRLRPRPADYDAAFLTEPGPRSRPAPRPALSARISTSPSASPPRA